MMYPSFDSLLQNVRPAVPYFLRSVDYAAQLACCRWDFAVEIHQLIDLGLNHNDLRWLVRNKMIEHRQEVTGPGDQARVFQDYCDISFTERSCFALTNLGVNRFRRLIDGNARSILLNDPVLDEDSSSEECADEADVGISQITVSLPRWDSERRVLGYNGLVVKRFKWNAMNQQAILIAFEEEGWPPRIFDPLPPQAEQDTKRRLSDTIKCLNRKQCHPILHFRGDGTGEGVIWEFTGQSGHA